MSNTRHSTTIKIIQMMLTCYAVCQNWTKIKGTLHWDQHASQV
jgi:hypothetical protein